MSNPIAELIRKKLYNAYTSCGPLNAFKAYHPYMRTISSTDAKTLDSLSLPYIIPDNGFHPQVRICIDFTHQFTRKIGKVEGKRPLTPEMFQFYAVRLYNYVKYYFNYVLSYKVDSEQELQDSFGNAQKQDNSEYAMLNFVNTLINYYLTEVSVERTRGDIGSCTITLRDSLNVDKNKKKSSLFFNYAATIFNQLFAPFLPVMVWARGRIYKDWYFPIFDGYIIASSPTNSAGFTSLTLTCKDVLELARTSNEMINPAVLQIDEYKTQSNINIYQKPLYGIDHMKIFEAMFHGGKLTYNPQTKTFNEGPDPKEIQPIVEKIGLGYSLSPITSQNSLSFEELDHFGSVSDAKSADDIQKLLDKDKAVHKDKFNMDYMIKTTSHTRPRYTIKWGDSITPYRVFGTQSPDVFTSDFSSRLEILQEVAGITYYDLHVDGAGNIHYHPMRLANDYLKYDVISYAGTTKKQFTHPYNFPGVQIVGLEETLNQNSILNLEELITFVRLSGTPEQTLGGDSVLYGLTGSAADKDLMSKYGFRQSRITNEMFNYNFPITGKIKFLDLAALAFIKFKNSELYTKSATLIFRPEMDISLPVFFMDDETVFYVNSISHSITVGGDATTTINCNFGRKAYQTPPDLANYMVITQKMFNSSTDKIVGPPEESQVEAIENEKKLLIQSIPADEWANSFGEDAKKIDSLEEQLAKAKQKIKESWANSADEVAKENAAKDATIAASVRAKQRDLLRH